MSNCPNCFKDTPLWQLYDVTDNNPEFCLYDSVVSEFTDIAGFPVMYYRAKSNMDRLFGEDSNQDYHNPVRTKLIYEPSEEPNIIDGLGIRSDETLQYASIPKSLYIRDIALGDITLQPMAGDVIKTLWNNRNYEIVDIGAEQNIFMAKKLIWEFILRPYRFSEQSLMAQQIHRSDIKFMIIWLYPYPDKGYADVTYPDGTKSIKVSTESLGIDVDTLKCGYTYRVNFDGSVEIYREVLVPEDNISSTSTYSNTNIPLEDLEVDALGDNNDIEVMSDAIDNYSDIDNILFTRTDYDLMLFGTNSIEPITQTEVNLLSQVGIISDQIQTITFHPSVNEYLYIIVPLNYKTVEISISGFVTEFIITTDIFIINGKTSPVTIYKSPYRQNGTSIDLTVKNFGRK